MCQASELHSFAGFLHILKLLLIGLQEQDELSPGVQIYLAQKPLHFSQISTHVSTSEWAAIPNQEKFKVHHSWATSLNSEFAEVNSLTAQGSPIN